MRGDDHAFPLRFKFRQKIGDDARSQNVEPVRRLVEHDDGGIVHDGNDERDLLLHARREVPHAHFRKAVYAEFETVQTEFAAGGISVSGAISALTPFRNDMLVLKNAAVENPDGDSLRIVDAYFSNADAVVSGAYSPDEFLPVLR